MIAARVALITILPVVMAGLTFILVLRKGWLMSLRKPIDGGRLFLGNPIFGNNKTWLGFLVMPIFSSLYSLIFFPNDLWLTFFAMGFAYSLFELPNSFTKRRLGIEEGGTSVRSVTRAVFFVVDKIDSVLGVSTAGYFLLPTTVSVFVWMFVLGCVVHFSTDVLMSALRLKGANRLRQ